jgi:hypothetical protein
LCYRQYVYDYKPEAQTSFETPDNQRLQNIIQIFTATGASFQSLGNLSQKFLKYQHPAVNRLYSSLLDVDDMLVLLTWCCRQTLAPSGSETGVVCTGCIFMKVNGE